MSAAVAIDSASALETTRAPRRGLVTWLTLAAVAITFAASGFVFSEPAPVDALTIGLIVLLPTVGLVTFTPGVLAYGAMWLVVAASLLLGASSSLDLKSTGIHVAVTIYLYAASVVIAAFVARSPRAHTELILKAWTLAALVAAVAAVLGYFRVIPGGYELFTEYDRASGTFKDPNVFGPFLVVPALYLLNAALQRSFGGMLLPLAGSAFLALGVFLSFSRGAWMVLAVALVIYGYLIMATTRQARVRLKIIALLFAGGILGALAVVAALSSDQVANLLSQRASLEQSYDVGSEGRFGGQEKATGIIVENPLGIGALEFSARHHPEAAHNVYLSMFLNAGWLGGAVYLVLVALTVVFGFRFAMRASDTRTIFLVVYATFVATAFEGAIIDSDHWRHFYLMMGLLWGMMAAARRPAQTPTDGHRPARLLGRAPRLDFSVRRPTIVGAA
jgi:O-antigen ligase